ncbi:unnamed protein product [Rangifer tarandus platyrhynchus]|uniref:Uncharacterized protein n=1 Tax=Rangifer tarandus platyrhynchus TaxID=3082113 RepID=A0ABN8YZ45_RANTA|nr:unnamed protein product [Rangifer tarandus platyrhynchus]
MGSTSSQEGSRPSLRPPGPGQGLERLVFPASLELVSFDWVCRSHLSGQSLRQRGTGFPVGQASFQLGWKVSTCGDAPCSSQNHEPPQERKHCSCCSPRGELSAGSLLLSVRPQGYLKGPWVWVAIPLGEEGGRRRGSCSRPFRPLRSKGLLRAPGNRGTPLGLLQTLYAVIKSELLHFILPQFAHL